MKIKNYFELAFSYIKGNIKLLINAFIIITVSISILLISLFMFFSINYGINEAIDHYPYSKTMLKTYSNLSDDNLLNDVPKNSEYTTFIAGGLVYKFDYENIMKESVPHPKEKIEFTSKIFIDDKQIEINTENLDNLYGKNPYFSYVAYNKKYSNCLFSSETNKFNQMFNSGNILLAGSIEINSGETLVSDLFCKLLNIKYDEIINKRISYYGFRYQYITNKDLIDEFKYNEGYIFKDFVIKGVYNHNNIDLINYGGMTSYINGYQLMNSSMIFSYEDINLMENVDDFKDNKLNYLKETDKRDGVYKVPFYTYQRINYSNIIDIINSLTNEKSNIRYANYGFDTKEYSKSIKSINSISIILILLSITIFISSIFGITNVIIYNLRKRNSYVGIQKAIGFTTKNINKTYILEQMITSFIVSIISIIISLIPIIIIYILENNFLHRYSDNISLSPKYLILSILIVVGMYLFITFIISNIIIKFNVKKKITDQLARE